jgi:hypothetical protein
MMVHRADRASCVFMVDPKLTANLSSSHDGIFCTHTASDRQTWTDDSTRSTVA